MKRILFLSFYYEPDLCAGSFRNTTLSRELAKQGADCGVEVIVLTTMPNRYRSYKVQAPEYEEEGNLKIHRIPLPSHRSGILDQIQAFRRYYSQVIQFAESESKPNLVFASSSRLFTAYLGHKIAKRFKVPLYLDIRDLFVDTISDVVRNPALRYILMPLLQTIERQTFQSADHINLISRGFESYFSKYSPTGTTFFTNGIDTEFVREGIDSGLPQSLGETISILYAGNIGEGQGLHRIVPQVAARLGSKYQFHIYGDGGAIHLLHREVDKCGLKNVLLHPPVPRDELIKRYKTADYLFMHLNDLPAFRKVLPSKTFELAAMNKPVLAGVSGYAAQFIREELQGFYVFEPCNAEALSDHLLKRSLPEIPDHIAFLDKYSRDKINRSMAASILSYL